MLHRSFKPAKCKTSLKLALSRLKLLKNRKDVQLKQLKRELAQLLESGQDQTARIRVEHVVREEKTIAAYELLEIYCELIAARLPIIESQKNCPIDLKEAITSVVFATPRCSDIPELQDVRKHLTAKYGKEFVSAAVELRPECGVSRMLVEKLSAMAPDGPTKVKILSGIAEEYDIKWDPKSFGEKELKPHEDLLNGPSTFEKASRMQTEPSSVQPPSKVQAPPAPEQQHNAPVNSEHNTRPSTRSENFASKDASGSQTAMPTPHSGPRPSGTRYERMEVRHSYSGDVNSFPSDRMNWNMEFKDATAAAQAAAESAERASMAARAAAELSSRGQYSAQSHKSNIHTSRDEGYTKNNHDNPDEDVGKFYANSQGSTKRSSRSNLDRSRDEGHTKNDHDNPDGNVGNFYGDSHRSTKGSSQPGSLRSNVASNDDLDKLMNDFLKGARYSENRSFEEEAVNGEKSGQGGIQTDSFNYFDEESSINEIRNISSHSHPKVDRCSQNSSEEAVKAETNTGFSGMNMNEQSIGSGAEFFSSGQGGIQSDSFNYFAEESIRKKNSSAPSHSRSSSRGDDYDVSPFSHPKYEIDGGEDPFDHGHLHTDTAQASSYSNASVIFDEPVSEDDHGIIFVTPKYDRQELNLYPATPGIESPSQLLSTDTWNTRQNMSGSFEKFSSVSHVFVEGHSPPKFDESSTKSAKPDEFLPVTFDESEGPSSESEDEVRNSRLGRTTDPSSLPQKTNIFFRTPDHSQRESHDGLTGSFLAEKSDSGNRKKDLNYSSDDEDEVVVVNKRGTEVSARARRKFGFDEEPSRQSSAELAKSQMISNDMASEPFYNQVEERKNDLSAQTSGQSLVNEVKTSNNTFPTESSFNMKDDELFRQSNLESGNVLKFGELTGGLRHKGYMCPPYSKIPSGETSSSKKAAEHSVSSSESFPSFSPVKKSSVKSAVSTKVGSKSSLRTPFADYGSDSDESEEELTQCSKREPDSRTSSKEVDNKLRLRAPVTFFDSDDEDSVEDIPKQTSNSTGRVGSGFSRRTKATTGSGASSRSKAAVGSVAPEPNSGADARKAHSRSFYHSETPPNLHSHIQNSGHWESPPEPRAEKQATSRPKPESSISRSSHPSETPPNPHSQTENWGRSPPEPRPARQSIFKPMPESKNLMQNEDLKSSGIGRPFSQDNLKSSADQATSKPIPESNISTRKENLKTSAFEPPPNRQENLQSSAKQETSKPMQAFNFTTWKENPKSSATEQPSTPLRTVTSASTESPKSSISSGEPPSRASSLKKATHVHPKLPDYDTIAAQLQSLRSNH